MKRIFITALIAAIGCSANSTATAFAQTRPGASSATTKSAKKGNVRPGSGNNATAPRPGTNTTPSARPGTNVVTPTRPGASVATPTRPGTSMHQPTRPGSTVRPQSPNPPYRPGMPPARPFTRPVPPTNWHAPHTTLWSDILGIAVGTTVQNAMSRLLSSGYNVTGYNDSETYLSNVSQYGFTWPDATMYYNNGRFVGSRFYYSTMGYDLTRYRQVYNYLTGLYGAPVSSSSTGEGTTSTWYGDGNQYITLDFGPMLTDAGRRYFTTLSIGI